jgi:hypothetical protein
MSKLKLVKDEAKDSKEKVEVIEAEDRSGVEKSPFKDTIKNKDMIEVIEAEVRSGEKISEKALWEMERAGLITSDGPDPEKISYFMVLPYGNRDGDTEFRLVDYSSRKEEYAKAWFERQRQVYYESMPLRNACPSGECFYFGAEDEREFSGKSWIHGKVILEDDNIVRTAFARMPEYRYARYHEKFIHSSWFKRVAWGTFNED